MTKERWMDLGLQIEPHLKEIARLVSQTGHPMADPAPNQAVGAGDRPDACLDV